jgi:CxxC motif-containing protein (DUF1111 family)
LKNKCTIAVATALTILNLAAFGSLASGISLRQQLLDVPATLNLGGDTTRPLDAPNAFSFPAGNLPPENARAFSFGNRLFNTNWVEAPASVKSFDGLGPLFNRVSCSGCHTKDGRGQPPLDGHGPMETMLMRISVPGTGQHGAPKPVPHYGDQLSERAINGLTPEGIVQISYVEMPGAYADREIYTLRKPTYSISQPGYGAVPEDILMSPRVAPHMIGLGLLEAVPEDTLLALADPDDADGDGVSGRVNRVWDSAQQKQTIGRFGWKAGQPDLSNQNASAALGDIGLTTDIHTRENCEVSQTECAAAINGGIPELKTEFLEKLTLYTATLAVPAQRNSANKAVAEGGKLFRDMGCAVCHMPTLKSSTSQFAEVANQTFHPYTDLLLHDMGEGLSDNRPDFEASGREWRTPPLWGLGLLQKVNTHENLLHDGRARGFAEAILWHGGEAEKAKEAFRTAAKEKRDALVAFLKSL